MEFGLCLGFQETQNSGLCPLAFKLTICGEASVQSRLSGEYGRSSHTPGPQPPAFSSLCPLAAMSLPHHVPVTPGPWSVPVFVHSLSSES